MNRHLIGASAAEAVAGDEDPHAHDVDHVAVPAGDGRRPLDDVVGLPPERLGEFLRRVRLSNGDPLPTIARQLSWHFTPTVLRMIESGEYPLTPEDLEVVLDGYQVGAPDLPTARARLEVDIDNRRMVSGAHEWRLNAANRTPNVLLDYVRFVRTMRRLPPGATLPRGSIRRQDLETLASSLGVACEAIEASLKAILTPHSVDAGDVELIATACGVTPATVKRYLAALTAGGWDPGGSDTGSESPSGDVTQPLVDRAGDDRAGDDRAGDDHVDPGDSTGPGDAAGPGEPVSRPAPTDDRADTDHTDEPDAGTGALRGRRKRGLLARLLPPGEDGA